MMAKHATLVRVVNIKPATSGVRLRRSGLRGREVGISLSTGSIPSR